MSQDNYNDPRDTISCIKEVGKKRICCECIGEATLAEYVSSNGDAYELCSYCPKNSFSLSIKDFSDRIDLAFEQHYMRTSDISQRRSGELLPSEFEVAAKITNKAATDVHFILKNKHLSNKPADGLSGTAYDGTHPYSRKDTEEWQNIWKLRWHDFENNLKTESRFFPREGATILEPIANYLYNKVLNGWFDDLSPLLLKAGPEFELNSLYRARVFQSSSTLLESLKHPDRELAPPPAYIASNGRMNAHGISVFYGALDKQTAIVEVRPPVGSSVVVGKFDIIRPILLLDLRSALTSDFDEGSIFDEDSEGRISQLEFLRFLATHIDKPVLPEETESGYLPTQVLADYLASITLFELDGIAFPSVQSPDAGTNVVLFHKSSRVGELDTVRTDVDAIDGFFAGGAFRRGYNVYVSGNESSEKNTSDAPENEDKRPVSLNTTRESLSVHQIEGVTYKDVLQHIHIHRN